VNSGVPTFLTPSYAGDVDRFALLRESMARCGITMPHVVVVPPGDASHFEATVLHADGLSLMTTDQVLPTPVEEARQRGLVRWRRRLPWNRGQRSLSGWRVQQLTKLLGDAAGLDRWVCLDSDAFFVRRIDAEEFLDPAGRLHLQEFRHRWVGREVLTAHERAADLLGLSPLTADPSCTYTGLLIPFDAEVIRDLRHHLETRHADHWYRSFFASGATEYACYGLYARHIDRLQMVSPVDRTWSFLSYEPPGPDFGDKLRELRDDQGLRVAMVHSQLEVDAERYRDALRRLWDGDGATRA